MSSKPFSVNCPHCKKSLVWQESERYRPFCSERCQQIDLGAWANEEYSIPVEDNELWSEEDLVSTDSNTPSTLQ